MSDSEQPAAEQTEAEQPEAEQAEAEQAEAKRASKTVSRRAALGMLAGGVVVGAVGSRIGTSSGTSSNYDSIVGERGYEGNWADGALKTFVPPGEFDPYFIFASGGHSGQVFVIGAPSMRLLKVIPVFTRDAWQGYGFGSDQSELVLNEGSDPAKSNMLGWGDTHHPALSETNGDYDGRWLYINDRANGRIAMIDLTDFKTKQIIDLPNLGSSHGGCFVTPNSDYVHISSMTPSPYLAPGGYAPLSDYSKYYRGASCWMAIDQKTGRIDMERSFQIELPPYTQDLADAGKLTSDGFGFINSYNTEMATGGTLDDPKQGLESTSIANDFDFMHVIDWKKAAEIVSNGGTEDMNGMKMIRLDVAIKEGVLHIVPEPRNPHGVDVSPSGDYIVVSGKLDPHASVFSAEKLKAAIAAKDYDGTDDFGVPILKMASCLEAQVELGNGPLPSQFDDKGNVYTSLFVDSAVAKWTLGTKAGVAEADAWKKVDHLPVNYNIGHLCAAEGDTVNPDGKYLIALNKWSIDRFPPLGTLHPQNFQLIDLESASMTILADMPIGMGEPHYTQMIRADKLVHTIRVYEPGTDPLTMSKSPFATDPGKEAIERSGKEVDVYMTAMRSHTTPDIVEVNLGDLVRFHITNIETTPDATHGFAIPGYNIETSLDPGEVVNIEMEANRAGSFAMYCSEFCSALHLEMQGWFLVKP
ncbi:MAG: Sec-dependent nitrous-oxide reductase [Actinomycetota bacterium]